MQKLFAMMTRRGSSQNSRCLERVARQASARAAARLPKERLCFVSCSERFSEGRTNCFPPLDSSWWVVRKVENGGPIACATICAP